jgi:uncharacterized protein (UPF0303 family)
MAIEEDLRRIQEQERRLQFDRFSPGDAWEIGLSLKQAAEARGARVAIDIQLQGRPLFFFAMPGSTPENVDWIRRKRNVVFLFFKSSYHVGLRLEQQGTSLQARDGYDPRDYAAHGGSFPITLVGTGCVGAITVSGLPSRADHILVTAAIAAHLAIDIADIALPTE